MSYRDRYTDCSVRWLQLAIPVIIGTLIVSCSSDPKITWPDDFGYEDSAVFEIAFDRFGSPSVPVVINDVHLNATFDTGNLVGPLVSNELATELGLPILGSNDIVTATGDKLGVMRTYGLDSLRAFGRNWTSLSVNEYVTNAEQVILAPGMIDDSRFTIDYPNRLMAVDRTRTPDTTVKEPSVPMIYSRRFPSLILVEGTINGHSTLFQINTGKANSTIDPDWARLLRLDPVHDGFHLDTVTIAGASFTVRLAKPDRYAALDQGLRQSIKACLGADALADMRITVDYNTRRVYLYRDGSEKRDAES